MPDSRPLRDRYIDLIDEIVQATLKGNIRSKEQVYQMLLQGVSTGTGEIFDRCLEEQINTTQHQVDNPVSEIKQAKAIRSLRALKTLSGEWERVQEQKHTSQAISGAVQSIITAQPTERLTALLRVTDPNRQQVLNLQQLAQLGKDLQQQAQQSSDPDSAQEIQQLSQGISAGLTSWQRLEDYVVSWIYDQNRGSLGFEGLPEQRGPWAVWAKQVNSPLPKSLFGAIAQNQPLFEWANKQPSLELAAWVELAVILQCLQRGLVAWFDKMVYDARVGAKLSISTFIVFAVIWSQIANALNQLMTTDQGSMLVNSCFQVCLQILRAFAQRDYFPLYGGVFASLNGNSLRDALNYLDEPLRRVEGTQEKARILTLLGYSLRAQGQYDRAISFHQQALEIARAASDRICEIANFNHLSRICVAQNNYSEAINYSQRALILSRQTGDRLGEANALTNLGYSEVFQAKEQAQLEPEVYERAIHYLEQGLQLLERLGDSVGGGYASHQSKALGFSSLGIAYVVIEQPQKAITYLEQGWQAAQFSGDLYLQGVNLAYLAQACYSLQNREQALYTGSLGAYLLEQIGSNDWRQPTGLLTILQGQIGAEAFQALLEQQRSKIIAFIGVDGYDYIPQLLQKYRDSM
ncbi:tetratricopeptide repeat protein [Allocoleopsis sp.]|uniref:tetratricopeptide repeat protein n=1 Tax=Allocoleopsis sp. TaxID=3088169 RepID=UPI002FD4C87B